MTHSHTNPERQNTDLPYFCPTSIPCWWGLTRPNWKQLSMAATSLVIWLYACVRYWPGPTLSSGLFPSLSGRGKAKRHAQRREKPWVRGWARPWGVGWRLSVSLSFCCCFLLVCLLLLFFFSFRDALTKIGLERNGDALFFILFFTIFCFLFSTCSHSLQTNLYSHKY